MINLVIIDEEKSEINQTINDLQQNQDLKIKGVYSNISNALTSLESEQVDLVIFNLKPNDHFSISTLKNIKNLPLFIFIAEDPCFAMEGFDLGVIDYILKPYNLERLEKSIRRARTLLINKKSITDTKNFLVIKNRCTYMIIPYDELYFIKSNKDFVQIATVEKVYTVWRKISDIEESLELAKQFLRVQKSYIINLNFAYKIVGNHIKLNGIDECIPIGEHYKPELYKRLGI